MAISEKCFGLWKIPHLAWIKPASFSTLENFKNVLWLLMSFSQDDIGMSADEQFLSPVRPSPPTQFFFQQLQKKKMKASDVVSLSISSAISKFMLCTHLKVTSCKLALYRLTLPHLQERGRWETKHFMGMALSAPQTPPAKTKNEQNILYRSWDPFLINSFCH